MAVTTGWLHLPSVPCRPGIVTTRQAAATPAGGTGCTRFFRQKNVPSCRKTCGTPPSGTGIAAPRRHSMGTELTCIFRRSAHGHIIGNDRHLRLKVKTPAFFRKGYRLMSA